MNPHELAGRREKVERLIRAIRAEVIISRTTAGIIIENLEAWPSFAWIQLAGKARCNPPSKATIAAVIAEVRRLGGDDSDDEETEPDWNELAQETYDADQRSDDEINERSPF